MIESAYVPARDLDQIRTWLSQLPGPTTLVDFEELIQLQNIQETTRIWRSEGQIVALAYVDSFNNLWFDLQPEATNSELEDAIISWGVRCQTKQNERLHTHNGLDACVRADNTLHLRILKDHGFELSEVRTLKYRFTKPDQIKKAVLPQGYSIRSVKGEEEVDALVALHQAAFGTQNHTAEDRLAAMRAPGYDPSLDLLATGPDGTPAAFCVASLETVEGQTVGHTDPIGTHPAHQGIGLASALVTHAMRLLFDRGATAVLTGTSSENLPMQRLATCLGFELFREDLWLTKRLD